jgi:hypothetical protein
VQNHSLRRDTEKIDREDSKEAMAVKKIPAFFNLTV